MWSSGQGEFVISVDAANKFMSEDVGQFLAIDRYAMNADIPASPSTGDADAVSFIASALNSNGFLGLIQFISQISYEWKE